MIKIERLPEPKVIAKIKQQWKTSYLTALAAFEANKSIENKQRKDIIERKYNHNQVKNTLKTMCSSKCAYCESHITHIGYGHIEHFKPKARYPELCFEWENFLLSCEICNSSAFKGDKFPIESEGGPFINPCDENPDNFFEFELDHSTGAANIIPQNKRAAITEMIIGLNRPDLVIHRSQVVRKIAFITLRAKEGDSQALSLLTHCMQRDQEYAAFARAFHRKFRLP